MTFDLVVVGGGPGGYVAAIRAAQLGSKTALVEMGALGGVCLNRGCIPSKALLDSTAIFSSVADGNVHGVKAEGLRLDWRALQKRRANIVARLTGGVGHLLEKAGVETVQGRGRVLSPEEVKVGKRTLKTTAVILATGSRPMELPHIPFDGDRVIGSREALTLREVPQSLGVIGGGAIGLEMGSVYARAGSKVTVFEMEGEIIPLMDPDLGRALRKSLARSGLEILTSTRVEGAQVGPKGVVLSWERGGEAGKTMVERVLVAVGRRPSKGGVDVASLGIETDAGGFVLVDRGPRIPRRCRSAGVSL